MQWGEEAFSPLTAEVHRKAAHEAQCLREPLFYMRLIAQANARAHAIYPCYLVLCSFADHLRQLRLRGRPPRIW